MNKYQCPKCGGDNIEATTMGCFGKDENRTWCLNEKCRFVGIGEDFRKNKCPECKEWEQSFWLYDKCLHRATEYWRERTGKELVSPDSTKLYKWLMDRIIDLEARESIISDSMDS